MNEPLDAVIKTDYSNQMTGFTKLFQSIVHSTVWQEEMHVKVVWVTLLALADRNGCVNASEPGLAKAAGVSLDQCLDALARFAAPDPYSRTKAFEGRRIQPIDGGWFIINHPKYRELASKDERRLKVRDAVSKHRARNQMKSDVINGNQSNHKQKQRAEAEATDETQDTDLPPDGGRVGGAAVVHVGQHPIVLKRFEEVLGYLRTVDAETLQRFTTQQRLTFDVRGTFAYWVTKFGHKRALLDGEREKVIRKALSANGGNVSELLYTIKGAAMDDWARQDLGRHDVTVLFRDRTHVEKYATRCEAFKKGVAHPFALKLQHAQEAV